MRRRALTVLALLLLAVSTGAQGIRPTSAVGGWVPYVTDTSLALATQTTSEEVLKTVTLPANFLPSLYRGFRIIATANTAANTNAKFLRFRVTNIGGTNVVQATTSTSGSQLWASIECWVTSSTTLMCLGQSGVHNASTAPVPYAITGRTFTADDAIVVTGQTAISAGDMTLTSTSVQFFRP